VRDFDLQAGDLQFGRQPLNLREGGVEFLAIPDDAVIGALFLVRRMIRRA